MSGIPPRRGRRQAGGVLKRRRGDEDAGMDDSSDEEDNHHLTENTKREKLGFVQEGGSPGINDGTSPEVEVETIPPSLSNGAYSSERVRNVILEDPDSNTLRIMLSTDNHLGYAENDTVRGNDSFAALEEVLYLAKEYSCDMVLLAGDLFHENRPTRRTLIKTMDIFRRYCMGPGAIKVQIVSSKQQKSPFVRGYVNYEDENYSVDLPVFSIHGNHDDPSRDGGNSELYAALDLLDVANLVNYFGKQEDTQNIRVDPILLKKGSTKVALYGLGSMRDERLNRMWKGEHLTFTRPSKTDEKDGVEWFNIFALHQNRDRGRGAKNCIKEDMIPDWIDFVCWGHEHECDIELTESVVGTFRISQPGSSVATSLVEGESLRKKIGILDVREGHFRLTAIPLTQVRSFEVATIKLADEQRLDPDDPKVDAKISKVLEERVRILIHDAREKRKELLKDAQAQGNGLAIYGNIDKQEDMKSPVPLKHIMYKENEVLVRLKVDHTGFSTMNNQRFGAKFVGDIANPTDILLFTRKKAESNGGRSRGARSMKDIAPIEPSDIEEMNIEELIVEQFESSNTKLELFDDKKISSALDSYVGKQEAQAINETLEKLLGKQQNRLIQNGSTTASGETDTLDGNKRDRSGAKGKGNNRDMNDLDEMDDEMDTDETLRSSQRYGSKPRQRSSQRSTHRSNVSNEDVKRFSKSEQKSQPLSNSTRGKGRGRKEATSYRDSDDEGSEYEYEQVLPRQRGRRKTKQDVAYEMEESDDNGREKEIQAIDPPARTRRKTPKRISYRMEESDDDNGEGDNSIVVEESRPPSKEASRNRVSSRSKPSIANKSSRSRRSVESSDGYSQSQLSFQPVKRKATHESTKSTKSSIRGRGRKRTYESDSDDGDEFAPSRRSFDDNESDWGTAKSGSTF